MINNVVFLILHFLICAAFFVVIQRPVFVGYNRKVSERAIGWSDLLKITSVGLKTDLAASAYLTAIPLLLLWIHAHAPFFSLRPALMVCEGIVALVIAIVTIADTVLYGPWRFRLDSSVFAYLKSLEGAFASVSKGYLISALFTWLVLSGVIFALLWLIGDFSNIYDVTFAADSVIDHVIIALLFVVCAGAVFAFIRGLKHRPNSPYMVYYSNEMFCNHAGVNPLFNVIYSLTVKDKTSKQFNVFDNEECNREMESLLPKTGTPQIRLLTTNRPKTIVFVIWESLSAYFVESLGGKKDVNPNFDRLCNDGVLFTHVDAGSYRTDPALVCTLSGYPGQPTTSIMRSTQKLRTLPAIPLALKDEGYEATAVYGGNMSIMHLIDYFLVSGHTRNVSVNDMPADANRNAWGVHDNYMFDWLYNDLTEHYNDPTRRFVTFLTLSSHQPFDVPYRRLDDKIENSYAFTDEHFGRFIDRLRKHPMWSDTLVVVLGDHGTHGEFLPMKRDIQPHIPLLLLGGVVKTPMRIDTIMSQTDLAATLLAQLDIDHSQFTFSRDVLADTYTQPFSVHVYNNGFLYRDPSGYTDYDNVAGRAVDGDNPERIRRGRMFMQYMMNDLAKR